MKNFGLSTCAIFGVVSAAICIGCSSQAQRVVVEISAGFSAVDELDRLTVTVVASRTVQGDELCEPYTQNFSIDGTEFEQVSLPLRIAVEPGENYNKILYVRVVGRSEGTVRIKMEKMISFYAGELDMSFLMTQDCLGVGTGRGQICQSGLPVRSPYAPIFDDDLNVIKNDQCLVQ